MLSLQRGIGKKQRDSSEIGKHTFLEHLWLVIFQQQIPSPVLIRLDRTLGKTESICHLLRVFMQVNKLIFSGFFCEFCVVLEGFFFWVVLVVSGLGFFVGLFWVCFIWSFRFGCFWVFFKLLTTLKCHESFKKVHEWHDEEKKHVPESRSNKINSQKIWN